MAVISGMPRGGASDWTVSVDRLIELEKQIDHNIDRLVGIKKQIIAAIEAVPDDRYRTLLDMRYRAYWDWDRIADAMQYDKRWIFRLHGRALMQVQIPKEAIESH